MNENLDPMQATDEKNEVARVKMPYSAPRLELYGRVAQLTTSGSGLMSESASCAMLSMFHGTC